jgi:hypothetical protein
VGERKPAVIEADLGAFDAGRAAIRARAAERELLGAT